MDNLNGVLFCGGNCDDDEQYFNFGKAIFEKAKQMNDKGIYFPLWGTCLGLQEFS